MAANKQSELEQLNSFLRGERAAVEAYNQCINHLTARSVIDVLADLQQSHQQRVRLLGARIEELGGTGQTDSAMWGSLTTVLERGTGKFNDAVAVAALEEGEAHERQQYERGLDNLTESTRQFINTKVLPEQQRGRDKLKQLKSQL